MNNSLGSSSELELYLTFLQVLGSIEVSVDVSAMLLVAVDSVCLSPGIVTDVIGSADFSLDEFPMVSVAVDSVGISPGPVSSFLEFVDILVDPGSVVAS